MSYLNSVSLIGFVGSDPEQRQARTTARSSPCFSLATQRSWKNAGDEWVSRPWHRIAVFRPRLAEHVLAMSRRALTFSSKARSSVPPTSSRSARARRARPRRSLRGRSAPMSCASSIAASPSPMRPSLNSCGFRRLTLLSGRYREKAPAIPGPFFFHLAATPTAGNEFQSFHRHCQENTRSPCGRKFGRAREGKGPMLAGSKCRCLVCRAERQFIAEMESESAWREASIHGDLRAFAKPLDLVSALHAPGNPANIGRSERLLKALVGENARASCGSFWQRLLLLAFIPAIHRTTSQVRMAFPSLAEDDVCQHAMAVLLEFLASKELQTRSSHLAFTVARRIRRGVFRWAIGELRLAAPEEIQESSFDRAGGSRAGRGGHDSRLFSRQLSARGMALARGAPAAHAIENPRPVLWRAGHAERAFSRGHSAPPAESDRETAPRGEEKSAAADGTLRAVVKGSPVPSEKNLIVPGLFSFFLTD